MIRLEQSGDKARCTIQDNGPGLSDSDQQKLFQRFSRLKSRPTGNEHSTGLGLFIAHKLTTLMHGTIVCDSTLGQGSTFTIEFPALIHEQISHSFA